MKKVIRLTESDLVRLVKRVLKEEGPEPIKTGERLVNVVYYFPEGSVRQGGAIPNYCEGEFMGKRDAYNPKDPMIVKNIANALETSGILDVLKKYHKDEAFGGSLPQFIYLNASTSSSGTGGVNAEVGQARLNYVENVVTQAFSSLGVDLSVVKKIIKREATKYFPSNVDKNFYDSTKLKPSDLDRFAVISIMNLTEMGLDVKGIQDIQRGLNKGSSMINTIFVDGVDESTIINYIKKLETFSDIIDLSNSINAGGKFESLEDFLNDQLFDDPDAIRTIASHLKMLAKRSGKQEDTVRLIKRPSVGLVGIEDAPRITIGTGN